MSADPTAGVTGGLNRRQFLVAGGMGAAAVTALGLLGPQIASAGAATTGRTKPSTNNDLEIAALAAGLEVLAVGTYKAALDATTAGTLGSVPLAGATFVQTAAGHHQAHLDRWNALLRGAGKPPVVAPNPKLKRRVDQALARVKDFDGAAKLVRDLEETAAATYLRAIPTLLSKDAINLAGSIHIIDMQHVAILNYVLGDYPVPDTFAKTGKAASA